MGPLTAPVTVIVERLSAVGQAKTKVCGPSVAGEPVEPTAYWTVQVLVLGTCVTVKPPAVTGPATGEPLRVPPVQAWAIPWKFNNWTTAVGPPESVGLPTDTVGRGTVGGVKLVQHLQSDAVSCRLLAFHCRVVVIGLAVEFTPSLLLEDAAHLLEEERHALF